MDGFLQQPQAFNTAEARNHEVILQQFKSHQQTKLDAYLEKVRQSEPRRYARVLQEQAKARLDDTSSPTSLPTAVAGHVPGHDIPPQPSAAASPEPILAASTPAPVSISDLTPAQPWGMKSPKVQLQFTPLLNLTSSRH